ncbi:MAG: EamA family transporter [Clostridia bacterium]|nr:EamA family transporter [Clostridia bacterium]
MKPQLKMIASTAIFGTLSLFIRHIPLTSAEVALFRAAVGLGCIMAAKGLAEKGLPIKSMGREGLLLFLSGAAMGFNWIFLFEAYKYTTVSVATLSYYFAPVIVMVACPLLFGERMTKKQLICSVGSTLGLVLVVNPGGLTEGGDPLRGVLFGLAAAALYATVILMNKRLTRVSGIDRTVLQFGAAAAVLLPYILLTTGFHFERMDAPGWLCLLAVCLIHSALAYILYFSALRELPGQEAAVLSYIDPLVAVLISLTVLAEPVAPVQLVGGAMILAFTLANEL